MLPYFVVLFIIFIIAVASNKFKKKIVIYDYIIMYILILFSGMRYYVGTDYELYLNLYNTISNVGPIVAIKNNGVEIGYSLLNYFVSLFFDSKYVIFFVVSAIIIIITVIFIKKHSDNYWVSILFYYCFSFYTNSLNIQRQYIAGSILLIAIYFWINKNKKYSIIFVIFASLFHRTALIFLLVIICINKIKINYKSLLCLVFLGGCGIGVYDKIIFLISNIFLKYKIYEDKIYDPGIGSYLTVIIFLIIPFIMIYQNKRYILDEKSRVHLKIMLLGVPLYILSLKSFLVMRIVMVYFGVYAIVLIPKIFKNSEIKLRLNLYFYYLIFMVVWFYFYLISQNGVIPYNTFLNI